VCSKPWLFSIAATSWYALLICRYKNDSYSARAPGIFVLLINTSGCSVCQAYACPTLFSSLWFRVNQIQTSFVKIWITCGILGGGGWVSWLRIDETCRCLSIFSCAWNAPQAAVWGCGCLKGKYLTDEYVWWCRVNQRGFNANGYACSWFVMAHLTQTQK